MNKVLLTAWLVAPVGIVAGLWFMTDREAARKDRAMMAARFAQPAAAAAGSKGEPAGEKLVQAELAYDEVVIVVKDLSGKASQQEPIHMASSWNGWNPADDSFKLTARSDLRWQIVIKRGKIDAPIEFKFTRGSSDSWECKSDLTSTSNRTLPKLDTSKLKPGDRPTFEFEVPAWEDMRPNSAARPDLDPYFKLPETGLMGTVKRVQVSGGGVWMVRDLLVWLPPGYEKPENASRAYPVLYLQDGQNVFIKMPTTPDEWQADETATKLVTAGLIEPLIIVGVPHAGKSRASEYLPFEMMDGIQPRGKQYAEWLVGEVMPRVERAFRVKAGAENTCVGGSSFGAIISLYTAQQYPQKIGKVLLESMSTNYGDGAALKFFAQQKTWPKTIYFGMGGKERGDDAKFAETNKQMADSAAKFEALAKEKLSPATGNIKIVVDEAGQHNETAWAKRLGPALEFLFPLGKGEKVEKKDK